jgi:hypothetical protein
MSYAIDQQGFNIRPQPMECRIAVRNLIPRL